MKTSRRKLLTLTGLGAGAALASCGGKKQSAEPTEAKVTIGGLPAVTLQRAKSGDGAQFLGADVLPGRGMNTYQIRAYLPGKGEINVLYAPPLQDAASILNGGLEDQWGNKSFAQGGAILLPYANRIRGRLSADGKSLTTNIAGHAVTLPANWKGKLPTATPCAMHGLMLDSKFTDVQQAGGDAPSVSAVLRAGNFSGHWLSQTDVTTKVTVQADRFMLDVTAKNVGNQPEPIGIGWHPYFALPSGNREQARLHVPGAERALVNNYDDVFPTGQVENVTGTPYDLTAPDGKPLGKLFMDDNFLGLRKEASGATVAEIRDPAAKYGLRITATSPQIHAIQIYAPPDKSFIVLEPQFNLADPYSEVWKPGTDTGMAMLQPGQSAEYHVELSLL